jgi:hypothetical protein
MIHFDFKVDEIDAENIFDCITDSITKYQDEIYKRNMNLLDDLDFKIDSEIDKTKLEIEWFHKRIEYLKKLASNMKNYRVD